MDFISEAIIYDTLYKKGKNLTMLIIAHRLSTIRNCDLIYVMDKGEVVEVGNHKELLNKKGIYYKLYETQVGPINNYDEINVLEEKEKKQIEKTIINEGDEIEYN